ncbi:MAG: AMP-binding protein [Bryobacterales bacterium]
MSTTTTAQQTARGAVEEQILGIVRELLTELGAHETARQVRPASSLERELGLGSLERVELLVRVESRFHRRLPDDFAQRAETVSDWITAIEGGTVSTAARYPIHQPGDAPPPPESALSFTGILQGRAQAHPERVQIHLLEEHGGQQISYGKLIERASLVAAGLRAAGLKRNETVAIMLPTGADFFYAFFGVMLAGGIAVPIYPPARANQIEEYVNRQVLILQNAEVRFLISFDQVRAAARIMRLKLPSLIGVTTVAALSERGRTAAIPNETPVDTFFIQYTSGSTGNPKGVVLSHSNVLANVRGIGRAVQARPDDAVVSWLPLYHDMGLIGSWLFSVYHGFPITVMSPLAFLSRPERWLWALSDSGGTLCPAPNFSYELCARKIPDEALEGVDLSRWRIAINAGEPVLPGTLERFAERFRPYGFRPEAYVPCYGLAESSVALTFPAIDRRPVIDTIRRDVFEMEGRAVTAGNFDGPVLRFVANGEALPGHEVRLVDDQEHDVDDRVQGRLLFRGPSKTSGYFRNPEATAAVVNADGWMDSGDLAYRAGGEIYITGRLKDCIIKAGHNIIPQEVEMAAAEVPGVRRGCVAAFGSVDPASGTERLIVVAETRAAGKAELERIRAAVVEAVNAKCGLPPDHIELVPPHTVPKTSSGKIRRNETRSMYEGGTLLRRAGSPAAQVLRLWLGNIGPWLRLSLRGLIEAVDRGIRAGWLWALAIVAGLLLRAVPSRTTMARGVAAVGAIILGLKGDRIQVRGALDTTRPAVLMINRSSSVDLPALAAALPVALFSADHRAVATLPAPLQFLFAPLVVPAVDSEANPPGGTLRQRIESALRNGETVVVFADVPIGTPPARSRFRLEAIEAARETGAPVYPVYLNCARVSPGAQGGSRPLTVTIGTAIHPEGNDPRRLVALREEIRNAIAQQEVAANV